ncbi:MAG: hypothetical protein ACJAWL_002962 [Motiliproteus sp.]
MLKSVNTICALSVLTAMLFAAGASAAPVKLSKSGICHSDSSSYYSRTKQYTSFPSVEKCLSAGGRLPLSSSTSEKKDPDAYSRDQFGSGWADTDGDCQDSRQETLIAQSTGQVRFKTGKDCRVTAGRWISPFSGKVIHDPSVMDIDHVVPLFWSWEHGAKGWIKAKRERLANDPANLVSVELSLNRSKGAKGPDEWLPPANQCQYVSRFLRIVKKYHLETSAIENRAFQGLLRKHCK